MTLRAAREALLRVIPDSKAKALPAAQLFQLAVIPTRTTGDRALRELLALGKIERMGKHPLLLYFKRKVSSRARRFYKVLHDP